MPHIMIVEDEDSLAVLLQYNLEAAGHEVEVSVRGDDAELRLKEAAPDLLLLDWMLPGLSGIELMRRIRMWPQTAELPVIMITARGEEDERIRGLNLGADDYIVKPFSIPELMARIQGLLRRSSPSLAVSVLRLGDVELNRETRRTRRGGTDVHLGPKEFRLLEFLMTRPGRVFSRAQLLDAVWGNNIHVDEEPLTVTLVG